MIDLLVKSRSPRAVFLFSCLFILIQAATSRFPVYAAYAPGIYGTVSDTSGLPLAGAHVTVAERQTGAVAGWDGNYRIYDLPPGRYTLIVSHLGYRDRISDNVIIYEGTPTLANFRLSPSRLSRPVASVTAPRQNHPRRYGRKIILSRETWRDTGAGKIGDVLRDVPGVSVLEGDGSQRLSLRGSPSRTVRVDLDGVPLNDAGTGEAEVGRIDLDRINKIQIEFEGIGGRVHLQSAVFSPADDTPHSIAASATYSAHNRNEAGFSAGKRYRQISSSLFYNRKSDGGGFKYRLDDGTVKQRINNQSHSSSFISGLRFSNAAVDIESGVYWEDSHRGIPGLIYAPPTPEASLSSGRLSARFALRRSSGSTGWSLTGYASDYSSRFTSPAEQYNPATGGIIVHIPEDNRQTGLRYGIVANSTVGFPIGRLRFDYTYRRDYYKGEDLLRDRVTIGGVGLGSADRTVKRLDTGGQLWGRTKLFGYHISPNIAVEMITDEGNEEYRTISPSFSAAVEKPFNRYSLELTAGWGRSLSAPPFNALFLVENSFAVGNKNLKPEQGECMSYGLALASDPLSRFSWRIGATRTVRTTRDLIVWKRNFFGKYYPDNIDRVKARGVELEASASVFNGRISLSGGYVYNDSFNDQPGDINFGRRTPLVARQSGSASIRVRILSLSLHLNGRWIGRRYSTESNQDPLSTAGMGLPPYEVYDFNISRQFRIGRLRVNGCLSVNNLLDESYRVIERSPMPGRTVGGKIGFMVY